MPALPPIARSVVAGWLVWALLTLSGTAVMVRIDIAQRREAFQTLSRRAHAVLSQRATQHDTILATLSLLAPSLAAGDRPEQRLPAVHPQVLAVLRRDRGQSWPAQAQDGIPIPAGRQSAQPATDGSSLAQAEEASRRNGHPAIAGLDPGTGAYTLVLAGEPTSFALRLDLGRLLPQEGWPLDRNGPVQVTLGWAGQHWTLQPGQPVSQQPLGLTAGFVFDQTLASASQPFDLHLQLATGPSLWPWRGIATWLLLVSAACYAVLTRWQTRRQVRAEQDRSRELQRIGQVSRLNQMGELAAGMAHELNQPLAAILANAQAANRLLAEDPPEIDTARQASANAAAQARRAADVVARLRRLVEQPAGGMTSQAVDLREVLDRLLELMAPQLNDLGVAVSVSGAAPPVRADPVAVEQILHNLLGNALQALAEVRAQQRHLGLSLAATAASASLSVRDSGAGIAPEHLARIFEPFFTTRKRGAGASHGLGLGLSLSQGLAESMQGQLQVDSAPESRDAKVAQGMQGRHRTGACFTLTLPLDLTLDSPAPAHPPTLKPDTPGLAS